MTRTGRFEGGASEPGAALAGELRLMRELSGKSLKELESLIFVSDSSLSRYLSGRLLPPWPVVVALCRLVRRDPGELLPLWDRARTPRPRTTRNNRLPFDVPDFTGRDDSVRLLLDGADGTVDAIDGMAGVGKTTLAVHVAHRLAERYPDGLLFLDLHGYTPGYEPLQPVRALRILLTGVGVPDAEMPQDERDEQAAVARWRAELAGRRVLVVLDNAAGAAQVLPLLPGAPGCRAIVTSRGRLIDLDGARNLSLDVLSEPEAAAMFASALGETGEREVGAEVVRLCGCLPLGIRLAAARLRHRPAWTLEHLAQLLRDEQRRLPTLETGQRGVAGAFGLSYRRMDAEGRRMFRLLALAPGAEIDRFAAASLAAVTLETADGLLAQLLDAHLLHQRRPDAYQFHDLLRDYARHTAVATDPAAQREAAMVRLLDYYVHVAVLAGAHLSTQIWRVEPPGCPSGPLPPITGTADALDWLDAEAANLAAAIRLAYESGRDRHASALSQIMIGYLQIRPGSAEIAEIVRIGLAAAQRLGDPVALARLHRSRGNLRTSAGDRGGARAELSRALEFARAAGDRQAEVVALHNIAFIDFANCDYAASLPVYEQAAALRRQYGEAGGNAMSIASLGYALAMLGRDREAAAHAREALLLSQEPDGRYPLTLCHCTLGLLALRADRLDEADEHFRHMLALTRETGHRAFEPHAHYRLATVQLRRGEQVTHLDFAEAAAAQAEGADNYILNLRGRVHLAAGHLGPAMDCYRESLDMAIARRNTYHEAFARRGIAAVLALTDPAAAPAQHAIARDLLAGLQIPETGLDP
ncbi:ATP-binding protein [Actinospica robiniae]|uniref:ATP-binding protein n=1 Tax=Actinospica robiniae TaxID=304901 RepID=UPI00146FB4D5|nr:helix-turn-helix domain-containing protein [Actinospica robiniae]